jgi:elongator complex protein 1
MSHSETKHDAPVVNCAFGPFQKDDQIAILLNNKMVEFYAGINGPCASHMKLGSISIEKVTPFPRQISWVQPNTFVVLSFDEGLRKDELFIIVFDSSYTIQGVSQAYIPQTVTNIAQLHSDPNLGVFGFQTNQGHIYECSLMDQQWFSAIKTKLPELCSAGISSCQLGSEYHERVWFGLSTRNKLYLNDRLLASDCTSFYLHNEYLITSTFEHIAKFSPLSQSADQFQISAAKDENSIGFHDKYRRIEQGSKIILATPSSINLVLQMPRGNLETVYPRALVLSTIRHHIER